MRPLPNSSTVRTRVAKAIAGVVVAALIAGCGGGDGDEDAGDPPVLRGETESGMVLVVEPDVTPADDETVAELEEYRTAVGNIAPVIYTRVTADNSANDSADTSRTVRIAPDAETMRLEGATQLEFLCSALDFVWIPQPQEDDAEELEETRVDLIERLCENGPAANEEIEPGATEVYYLVIDRGVPTQDFRELAFFGPRDQQLVPADED